MSINENKGNTKEEIFSGGIIMTSEAFVKGMGAGLIVGSIVYVASSTHNHKKKCCGKKNVMGRALRNLGDLVENVTDVFS